MLRNKDISLGRDIKVTIACLMKMRQNGNFVVGVNDSFKWNV